jgi:hypothetical protein
VAVASGPVGWRSVSGSAKDFFVSYTGADQAWAEWIADQLEAAGYATVLQAWDFRPGENFILRMNQALAEAERVLAVLSPRYFTSSYAADEWTAALVRAAGEADRLLTVRIEPCALPPLFANRIYIDLAGLDEQAALDQACDVCLSYTDIDLGIRGRAIGLLARVLYGDLPS